jgi:hypothetical protein
VQLSAQTGRIVLGNLQFNWTQQAQFINYTVITPSVVDLPAYMNALDDLTEIVQGIATGQPPWQSPGAPCNMPVPAVQKCVPAMQHGF